MATKSGLRKSSLKARLAIIRSLLDGVLWMANKKETGKKLAGQPSEFCDRYQQAQSLITYLDDEIKQSEKTPAKDKKEEDIDTKLAPQLKALSDTLEKLGEFSYLSGEKNNVEDEKFSSLLTEFATTEGKPSGVLQNLGGIASMVERLEAEKRFVDERYQDAANQMIEQQIERMYLVQKKVEAKIAEDGRKKIEVADTAVDNAAADNAQVVPGGIIDDLHRQALARLPAMFNQQRAAVDTLCQETNEKLNDRRQQQLHQAISMEVIGKKLRDPSQHDPLHPEQTLYGAGLLSTLHQSGKSTKETPKGQAILGAFFSNNGFEMTQVGNSRVPIPGIGRIFQIDFLNILKPGLVIRHGSDPKHPNAYEVANANWKQSGCGLIGKEDRSEALKLLIHSVARRLIAEAEKNGETIDLKDIDIKLDVPDDLAELAMQYAIEAGFHPKNVYSFYEKDTLYTNVADKDKAYERSYKSFKPLRDKYLDNDEKEYKKKIHELEVKHIGAKYENPDRVRPSDTHKVLIREADTAEIGLSADKELPLIPVAATATGWQPAPQVDSQKLRQFNELSLEEQERIMRAANAAQALAVITQKTVDDAYVFSPEKQVELFKLVSVDRQMQLLALNLEYELDDNLCVKERFQDPVVMGKLVASLDERQAYALFASVGTHSGAAPLPAERQGDVGPLLPALARQILRCMTRQQQDYVRAETAKQNLLGSASVVYSSRFVGPLGSSLREGKVRQSPQFKQLEPVTAQQVSDVVRGVIVEDAHVAQVLEQAAKFGVEGDPLTRKRRRSALKEFVRKLPDASLATYLSLTMYPEKIIKQFVEDFGNDKLKALLQEHALSFSQKTALLATYLKESKSEYEDAAKDFMGQLSDDQLAAMLTQVTDTGVQKALFSFLKDDPQRNVVMQKIKAPEVLETLFSDMKVDSPVVGAAKVLDWQKIGDVIKDSHDPLWVQAAVRALLRLDKSSVDHLIALDSNLVLPALASEYSKLEKTQQQALVLKVRENDSTNIASCWKSILLSLPLKTENDRKEFNFRIEEALDYVFDLNGLSQIYEALGTDWRRQQFAARLIDRYKKMSPENLAQLVSRLEKPLDFIVNNETLLKGKAAELIVALLNGRATSADIRSTLLDALVHDERVAVKGGQGRMRVFEALQDVEDKKNYLVALLLPTTRPPLLAADAYKMIDVLQRDHGVAQAEELAKSVAGENFQRPPAPGVR